MAIDAILAPPPALQPEPPVRADSRQVAADLAVLIALAWWATGLTWGSGGREPHVLTIGLVLLGIAAITVAPWRVLPILPLVSGLLVGGSAFLVTAMAPTGWRGANEAASWVYASMLLLVVAAWARTGWRRDALLMLLVAGPLLSFGRGWLAWWGGADPSRPFIGTFYWHNQQAIFLVLGVLAGFALAMAHRRVVRYAGWLAVALCGSGVVVSTSRASLAALVLGFVMLSVGAASVKAWKVAAGGPVAMAVIAGSAWLLTGPPFFPTRMSPFAGTEARASTGQSLSTNGGHRLDDWRWAVRVFEHWPWSGTGFHGFVAGSKQLAGAGPGSLTPFAHNGLLQLLVDGGLLLSVPVLLALLLLAAGSARRLLAARRAQDWATLGGGVALVVLAVHSAVDFDWSYPALLSAFALTGVLALGLEPARPAQDGMPRRGLGLCILGLLSLAAVAAWGGGLHLNVPLGGHA